MLRYAEFTTCLLSPRNMHNARLQYNRRVCLCEQVSYRVLVNICTVGDTK